MRLSLVCCKLWPSCILLRKLLLTLQWPHWLIQAIMRQLHALPLISVCVVRQGKVGLTRGDNACYQNSVLQALFMVPGLVDYFLGCEGQTPLHGHSPVVASLGQLFKKMSSAAPGTVVSTSG